MNLDRTPPQIASAAAEEIRALNHRTCDPVASYVAPNAVSDVVNAVVRLLAMLPQSLEQAIQGLDAHDEQGRIRMDNGTDAVYQVEMARQATQDAISHVQQAQEALKRAASPLSHMGASWDEDAVEA